MSSRKTSPKAIIVLLLIVAVYVVARVSQTPSTVAPSTPRATVAEPARDTDDDEPTASRDEDRHAGAGAGGHGRSTMGLPRGRWAGGPPLYPRGHG